MRASQLREGLVERTPEVPLSGAVEGDEVSVVAGPKGHPEAVKKRARGTPSPREGGARPRDTGPGEAPARWHDPAWRCRRHSDAGKRAAGDKRSVEPTNERQEHYSLH